MNGNPARVSSAHCMTACGGNSKEFCGGRLKVNIFYKEFIGVAINVTRPEVVSQTTMYLGYLHLDMYALARGTRCITPSYKKRLALSI